MEGVRCRKMVEWDTYVRSECGAWPEELGVREL